MSSYFNKFSFDGILKNHDNNVMKIFADIEYDKYDYSFNKCRLVCESGKEKEFHDFLEINNGKMSIAGQFNAETSISISGVRWRRICGNAAEVDFSEIVERRANADTIERGKYFISIVIDSAPAVWIDGFGSMDYLGSIQATRKHGDEILMSRDYGELALADYYDYEKGAVGDCKSEIKIKRTKVLINSKFDIGIDVDDLIGKVEDDLGDVLSVLSLISRKVVNWHEFELVLIPENENQFFKLNRRRPCYSNRSTKVDHILHQEALKNGIFKSLLCEYKKSGYKEMIQRAILFLAASQERNTIEGEIQAAYSALEIATDACAKKLGIDAILGRDRLKQLLNSLRIVIETELEENDDKLGKAKHELKEKVSELKRRPLACKLLDVLRMSDIVLIDLWESQVVDNLEEKIHSIISRRNKIIHTGEAVNLDQIYCDLLRIQAITERLLFYLMNFNEIRRYLYFGYNSLHCVRDFG